MKFLFPLKKSSKAWISNKGALSADLKRSNMTNRVFCLDDITPESIGDYLDKDAIGSKQDNCDDFVIEKALGIFKKELEKNTKKRKIYYSGLKEKVSAFALQSFLAEHCKMFMDDAYSSQENILSLIDCFPNSVRCVSRDFQGNTSKINEFFPPLPENRPGMIAQAVTQVMCFKKGDDFLLWKTNNEFECFTANPLAGSANDIIGIVEKIKKALGKTPNEYKSFFSITSEHSVRYNNNNEFETKSGDLTIDCHSPLAEKFFKNQKLKKLPDSDSSSNAGFFNRLLNRVIIPFLIGITVIPTILIAIEYLWKRFGPAPKGKGAELTTPAGESKEAKPDDNSSVWSEVATFGLFFRNRVGLVAKSVTPSPQELGKVPDKLKKRLFPLI
jgi:hypothetical protein